MDICLDKLDHWVINDDGSLALWEIWWRSTKKGLGKQADFLWNSLTLLVQCICLQLILILIRFDVGSYNVYMILLRGYVGLNFSTMGFVEMNFILRYLQIFVWGRVKEINEELAIQCIARTMLLVAIACSYCINFNVPMITFFMTFSNLHMKTITVETKLCQQEANPHFDFWNLR